MRVAAAPAPTVVALATELPITADGELALMVAQARQRSTTARLIQFPENKAHLDQSDLDRLFADRLDGEGTRT